MDITFRNAELSDARSISALVSALSSEHIAQTLGDGGLELLLSSMDLAATRERIEDQWLHLCAFNVDKLVGVVVVKPKCHLYHLFVETDFQNKGIGSQLFAKADAATLAKTKAKLSTVNSSLNVVQVYQGLGFVADGPISDTNGVRCQPMVRSDG